jgi:predicted ATPase
MSGALSNRGSAFVGRVRALARLTAALDRSFAGRSVLVLVSGEAGIGKTALAARLAEEASARGATTAWGTCWHAEQAPGFWPWTQVIRSLSGDISGELVAELAPSERAQLARLAPELEVGAGGEPPGGGGGSEQARFELFAAAATFLERTARLRPLLVVLDDLQWADPSSLDLLLFVARRAQPVPLLVTGAYRHDEMDPGSAQARLLVELAGAAEPVRLAGLDEEEVAELVRLIAGDDIADRWTAEVKRRSGGHPFFVRELSYLIATHPEPGEWVAVPAAVRVVIERRPWCGGRARLPSDSGSPARSPRWPSGRETGSDEPRASSCGPTPSSSSARRPSEPSWPNISAWRVSSASPATTIWS